MSWSNSKRSPKLHGQGFQLGQHGTLRQWWISLLTLGLLGLTACGGGNNPLSDGGGGGKKAGFEVKVVVGSALEEFCIQGTDRFNQTNPKLDGGKQFHVTCTAAGSGDVVNNLLAQAQQVKSGVLPAESPELPVMISVDGEVYHSQLIAQMDKIFPGQGYVPEITDSPMLASSPMVFMAQTDVANALRKVDDPFKALVSAKTHRDLHASGPPTVIYYVQAAPTRSNSGLQTLIAQFVAVSGKRPEDLTKADVQKFQPQIQRIQSKVTRYGKSTGSLARAMVQNGPFWASIGSVYESSVIEANANVQPGQPRYEAVYPKATFSSNMRAILLKGPWVSEDEQAAAQKFIEYLRSKEIQQIATAQGLRPGTPGVPLGPKFSPEFGVDPNASYDSYRPPAPDVVDAMLKSWQDVAKKPSLVVVVVDTSGSMSGTKLPSVQNTLTTYINSLGPKGRIALIDFDSEIRPPVVVEGTPAGRDRGIQFVSSLRANGGTRLYDAALFARNWLRENRRADAINAVLILTDGEDSGSQINLDRLSQELRQSGFNTDDRIAFFTIGYGQEGEFNPQALQQIADLNGGYYRKGDPETIAQVMADLQVEF